MHTIDITVLMWFNRLAGINHGFDSLVAIFTNFSPVIFGALFLLCFFWRRGQSDAIRRTVILSGLSGLLALGAVVAIASVFYRARPFIALPSEVHLLIPHAVDSSFPSDHATASAAFAVGMWHAPSRPARWIFTVTALMVGLSRLVAGVHWPSDILGSFLLGAICAEVLFKLGAPLLAPLLKWTLAQVTKLEVRIGR
jgi:undecaprenyl-diphosphatase